MNGDAFVSSENRSTGLVRAKRRFLLLAGLIALVPVLVLSGGAPLAVAYEMLLNALLFGGMALRWAIAPTRAPRVEGGTIRVDHAGRLLLSPPTGKTRVIAEAGELVQGLLAPTVDGMLVRFDRKGLRLPLFVRVATEEEGLSLVRALAFDAAHVAAEMKVASGLLSMSVKKQLAILLGPAVLMIACAIAFASQLGRGGPPVLLAGITLILAYIMGATYLPMTVRVGTDVIYTRWLGRERIFPLSRIRIAQIYEDFISSKTQHGVRLTLDDWTQVRIPTGQTDLAGNNAKQLWHRINEAIAARGDGAVVPANVLARGGATAVEWVRELRRVGTGLVDHRTPAPPVDAWLRIVEDSAASPADRASAAVAAVAGSDDTVKRRVRVAADASALPRLRVALTRIAEDADEEQVAVAMESLAESADSPK